MASRFRTRIEPSRHVLTPEQKAECLATAIRAIEPLREPTTGIWSKAYEDWCDTHYSNGMPMPSAPEYATFRTGLVTCALCERETDGEDLCASCRGVVEQDERGYEDKRIHSFDPVREP